MRSKKMFGLSISLILINLASILERADENLLPAVYKEVSAAFNAGPTDLGYLTFLMNFLKSIASPLAGVLALQYDRPAVLAIGTVFWAVSTGAVGVSQYFGQVAFWRAVNGFGLAIVIPALQSFIADSYKDGTRGAGFGLLALIGSVGGIGGSVLATIVAGSDYYGFPGWRLAFIAVAFVTFGQQWRASSAFHLEGFMDSGTISNESFDNSSSAALNSFFAIGCAIGSFLGGIIADRLSRYYPDSARIMCAQFSAFMGIPFSWILLTAIPQSVEYWSAYAVTLFLMGITISWCATCANNPMFAEVVPPRHRTMIYAFDRAFEGSFGSLASPAVGMVTEKIYGYNAKTVDLAHGSVKGAYALSRGLLTMMIVPFGLCFMFYTPLYYLFKRDRDNARLASIKEQELI
ncbi:hypothetical protein PR202_gb10532 [Eleusine coracana subsp. coracana]|uniref:Major facilitator superfamily (MFS) profile domain-containing protein n=1 Tax=Eleusine coracana subsp. coracana TaxID=191504 RepID=A0AAV5EJI6_ELECO|nr:hypothetical protein PR202_gb10532 [Eleusine coracana subsp. coracana]